MSTSVSFGIGAVGVLLLAVGAERSAGMGMEAFGPAGEHMSRQSDWPNGVEEVLRDPARVYWNWVNGSERAYYDGDIEAVNRLLEQYAAVDLGAHPVVIVAGRPSAQSFDGKLTPFVVAFDFPGRLEKNLRQREADAALIPLAPQLVVFVDAKLAEQLDELNIPENVTLPTSRLRIEAALDHISAERDAVDPALDERVARFVEGHPRRERPSDE